MITTTSVLVRRRLSGALHKELRVVTNDGCQPTAWEIIDNAGDVPYCLVDGHRHDLTEHEVKGLKKAVEEFLKEEKKEVDANGRELRRRKSRNR